VPIDSVFNDKFESRIDYQFVASRCLLLLYFYKLIMALQFVKSERGKNILVDDGYMYQLESERPEKSIWRCVKYKQKCKGRLHMSNHEKVKFY